MVDVEAVGPEEERRAAVRQALGALTGLLPVGVVGVDPEGRSWYHSQRWEDATGAIGTEFRDRPWFEAVHPEDVPVLRSQWRRRTERRGALGPFRVRSRAGAVRECRAEAISMVEPDGSLGGYLVVVRDAEETGAPALSSGHVTEAVLDRCEDIITILEPDGRWRWSSAGALRLVGHQPRFDPAQGIFQFVHPEEVDEARKTLERLVAEGGQPSEKIEYRVKAADGSWRHLETVVDVLIEDPAIRGIVLHSRDVTERRRALDALEAGHQRLASVVANMSAGVVLEDESGLVLLANQAYVDLCRLDCSPSDLEGRPVTDFGLRQGRYVLDPPAMLEAIRTRVRERQRVTGERIPVVDGRIIERDFIPVWVSGEYRGQLWMFRDVTDQARAEAERERLLASEREEHRRAAELEAYRSEYLASVSHELRTPLTSIVGYTQMLRDLLEAGEAEEQRHYLDVIERNVERLFQLSGDLLLLESLESDLSEPRLTEIDVDDLVRSALDVVTPRARDEGVELVAETEPGPPLLGDRGRLGQLLDILLSNAVTFTERDGTVSVRAAHDASGARWVLEVADTGIGISEEDQPHVFDRFYRGSNARMRGFPGSGLGLSIARAVVDLHQGEISVRSCVGSGTTFVVRLPTVEDETVGGSAGRG